MKSRALAKELARIVGEDGVLWRDEDLMLYEYDGLSSMRQPDVVVFPRTTAHVVQIAKLAQLHDLPVVARGAGTGLSGGSVATEGGILLGFSRLIPPARRRAPSAAMWQRIPAAPTLWPMELPRTMS